MSESIRPDITPEIRAVAEDTFAENLPPTAAELSLDVEWDSDTCHCGESVNGHGYHDNHGAVPMRDHAQVTATQMGRVISAVIVALEEHRLVSMHPDTCRFCATLQGALDQLGGSR